MSQSKRGSILEAIANVVAGFWINFGANLLILPLFGFSTLSFGKNMLIGVIYTVISLVRSYVLRRTFDRMSIFNVSVK